MDDADLERVKQLTAELRELQQHLDAKHFGTATDRVRMSFTANDLDDLLGAVGHLLVVAPQDDPELEPRITRMRVLWDRLSTEQANLAHHRSAL